MQEKLDVQEMEKGIDTVKELLQDVFSTTEEFILPEEADEIVGNNV